MDSFSSKNFTNFISLYNSYGYMKDVEIEMAKSILLQRDIRYATDTLSLKYLGTTISENPDPTEFLIYNNKKLDELELEELLKNYLTGRVVHSNHEGYGFMDFGPSSNDLHWEEKTTS